VVIFRIFFAACIAVICSIGQSFAQYKLRLVVLGEAANHKKDPVFVAGNFNGWNPADASYQLRTENGMLVYELQNLTTGIYEFKFTRGSWEKAACSKSGADAGNYVVKLYSDTTLFYTIDAWKDDFAPVEKKHTSSANVKVVDTAFLIPQLNRKRRISIYLPEDYKRSAKRYPVIYMHDGQNLFDEYLSSFGEWGVDECLDSLIKKGKKACIVVGIDNAERRMNEYNPSYFEKAGEGEGDAYVNFMVQTLKPFIDSSYRTLPGRENTLVAGSSMGGLISYYAILTHPDVFGKAGIFSPAFWTAKDISKMTDSLGSKIKGMLFFYMGGLEGDKYLSDMQETCDKMGRISSSFIYTAIDSQGTHNERAWRKWFAEFYEWIISDGNNYLIKTSD
jgi:predicted alpha/beta superfamily hydrolase